VAELVDALGSGSSGCMPVGVRVPSSAPSEKGNVPNLVLLLLIGDIFCRDSG
jgi:hypothetical protein